MMKKRAAVYPEKNERIQIMSTLLGVLSLVSFALVILLGLGLLITDDKLLVGLALLVVIGLAIIFRGLRARLTT